jgi:hypothetical protein
MRKGIKTFDKGLWLTSPIDTMPEGTLRRGRGISPLSRFSIRSRFGSVRLYILNAHTIYRFANAWYSGVSTAVYKAAASLKTGLSGARLSFLSMAPTAGVKAFLFCAGGGELFKIDEDDNVTKWGISTPGNGPGLADGGAGDLADGTYQYKLTFYNSISGHRSNPSPDAEGVALLLHCEGVDGAVIFTDSSSYTHTVGVNGTAQIDTAQYKIGAASGLFDGTALTDYLNVPHESLIFNYQSNRFTIDFWVMFATVATPMALYSQGFAQEHIVLYFDGYQNLLRLSIISSDRIITQQEIAWVPVISTWYHVALIRGWDNNANDWALCVDGVAIHTWTESSVIPSISDDIEIGRIDTGTIIAEGEADVVLQCSGAQLSTAQEKWGTASALFDGANDLIYGSHDTFADVNPFLNLVDNWTIDLWVRHDIPAAGTECYISWGDQPPLVYGGGVYQDWQ